MDNGFQDQIRDFLYTILLLSLGAAIGFYVLPSVVHSNQMDRILQLGFIEGRWSIINDLSNGAGVVKGNSIYIYPDTTSNFYFSIKNKGTLNEKQ